MPAIPPLLLLPLTASALVFPSPPAEGSDITLVTFAEGDPTERQWREVNDPVMGGKSTGTFSVQNGVGVFDGEVVDVPSLSAPGFIKTSTVDKAPFEDISSCSALFLKARAKADYAGYRISFGTKKSFGCSFFTGGFKSHFDIPASADDTFQLVEIPFTNFSNCNSDATGEPSKTCASDPSVCPDAGTLRDIKTITVWAEGAKGTVHLEIDSIGATGCASAAATAAGGAADACTTYNKVVDGTCAESCLGSMVGICPVGLVVAKGGLEKGTCSSLGYTVAAGSTSQKAGPCGTLTFKTYTQPGSVSRLGHGVERKRRASSTSATADEIVLATFDGDAKTTHEWKELNDPVMGGESTGTFSVVNGTGRFQGQVVDVPSLQAPGFIKAQTQDSDAFPDISSCASIVVTARTSTPYDGYRFQFGTKRGLFCSFFSSGFKSHFDAPVSDSFQRVVIPLTNFSDCNSDSTGEPSKICAEDKSVCPDKGTLQNVKTIAVWGEGAAGTVDLEIKSVSAIGCAARADPPAAANLAQESGEDIILATFVPGDATAHTWQELNDPVMGGGSTGTFTVSDNLGMFRGEVVDVPSLKAPGFIKAQTSDSVSFADISSCTAIVINARAAVPYDGYRFQFGNKRAPFCSFFSSGFKSHFDAPVSDEIQRIEIPLANFSDCNSDSTGEPSKLCSEDPSVCPDQATLKDVETIAIWAEGAAGTVHLDIKSIGATGCTAVKSAEPGFNGQNTCKGPVQKGLRYNMSGRTDEPALPFPLADGETLATGVCCDSAYAPYAEPKYTFNRTDVNFFATLEQQQLPVTFYDSVCGIPLFKAPQNRTFEEFKADTIEHGWPSFRPAEVVDGNVKILDNGYVISKCGTHLGSNVPDEKGTRYCMDTSCISGNPSARD